ncbi:hypothetical protein GW17_00030640 [Ensete ventricosum]|nr:hypothetical protein GW17_00030640 [Ensete ventricosum]
MDPSAILIAFMLLLYSTAPVVSGSYCPPAMPKPPRSKHHRPRSPAGPRTGKPPVIGYPPVIGNPPITFPPVIGRPPGIGAPPGTFPPGNTPSVPSPGTTPPGNTPSVPSPGSTTTCPVDAIKIGACVDLLGGLVHIVIGDPVVNQCCPLLQGLLELEAAVCLCTTIRLRLLSINIYLPLALQLLITCGMTPPPGFTCTVN